MIEFHIQISIASMFPSPEEFATRRALEAMLADHVGPISGAGAGGGVMDVHVTVADESEVVVRTQITALVAKLGIASRSRITARPVTVEPEPPDEPAAQLEPEPPDEPAAEHELPQAHPAAARELLALGCRQGYVTYDEINHHLPPEVVSSAGIDAWLYLLEAAGIEVREDQPGN